MTPQVRLQALKPGAATELNVETLEAIAGDAPSAALARTAVVGVPLAGVMVDAGLQPSKAAVKRLIKVNDLPQTCVGHPLPTTWRLSDTLLCYMWVPCGMSGSLRVFRSLPSLEHSKAAVKRLINVSDLSRTCPPVASAPGVLLLHVASM